ncbi:hypothetical protein VNO77_50252 [Canavalia gladiata]|uniref:Uncharacterized protein n=1 Tax=Canavalia gladiata TaxID=3824 RepID=A0AAN9PES0_CANGL
MKGQESRVKSQESRVKSSEDERPRVKSQESRVKSSEDEWPRVKSQERARTNIPQWWDAHRKEFNVVKKVFNGRIERWEDVKNKWPLLFAKEKFVLLVEELGHPLMDLPTHRIEEYHIP